MDVMESLTKLPEILGGRPNLILRKAIRDLFKNEPKNEVVSNLVEIMGEDPAPLPELLSTPQNRHFEPRSRRPRSRRRGTRYERADDRRKFSNNGSLRKSNFNRNDPAAAEAGEKSWREERKSQQQGNRHLEENGQIKNAWRRGKFNAAVHLQNSLQDTENAHMKQASPKLNSQEANSFPPHRFDTEHMTAVIMPEDIHPNEMVPKKKQHAVSVKNERHSVEESPHPSDIANKEVPKIITSDEKKVKENIPQLMSLPTLEDIKIQSFHEKPLSPPTSQFDISEDINKEEIYIRSQSPPHFPGENSQPRQNVPKPQKKMRTFPPNMPIDIFFANIDRLSHVERGEILHDYIAQLIQENHVLRNANKRLVFKYDERAIDGEYAISRNNEEFMTQSRHLRKPENYPKHSHGTSKHAINEKNMFKEGSVVNHHHAEDTKTLKKTEKKDLAECSSIENSAKKIDSLEQKNSSLEDGFAPTPSQGENGNWTDLSPSALEDQAISTSDFNPSIMGDVRVRNDVHRPKGDVRATPLPQQHRPADRRKVLSLSPEKIRKKGMNIHAKEFSMQNAVHQITSPPRSVNTNEDEEPVLTYEDFVRLRKSEIARMEYEDMMENVGFQEHLIHEAEFAELYPPYGLEDAYGMPHVPMPRQHHARRHHHHQGRNLEPPHHMHRVPPPHRHVSREQHRQRHHGPPAIHRLPHGRKYPAYHY